MWGVAWHEISERQLVVIVNGCNSALGLFKIEHHLRKPLRVLNLRLD